MILLIRLAKRSKSLSNPTLHNYNKNDIPTQAAQKDDKLYGMDAIT